MAISQKLLSDGGSDVVGTGTHVVPLLVLVPGLVLGLGLGLVLGRRDEGA